MIKIAILTPKNSYSYVRDALKDVEGEKEYIFYDNLNQLKDIYRENAHKFDGVVTSGPIGFEIIRKNTKITTPVYYIEIAKYELYKCLFQVLSENPGIDFSRVYIDFVSEVEKEYWLEDTFSKGKEPIFLPLDYSDVKLYENFKEKYLRLIVENKVDLILTRISNMLSFLDTLNVPYIFLFPSKNTIKETVEFAIRDIKASKADSKEIVMGKITSDGDINELKNRLGYDFKNFITQKVDDYVEVFMLKKEFFNIVPKEIIKKEYKSKVNIGWGGGASISEARFYADESYRKNVESNGEVLCLIEAGGTTILTGTSEESKKDLDIIERLKEINITGEKARELIELYKRGEEVSIDKLAKYLNTTERTTSRILLKLEDSKMADYSIEKITRGRPKKVYRFTF